MQYLPRKTQTPLPGKIIDLKIQDDNAKIKSAINDSDGLAALQAADEVLAVGASASDTVAVVDSGSAANSYGALVDKVTVIDFG